LLQEAVRVELRRRQLLAETDRYIEHLGEEVGEPSDEAIARAEALARRIKRQKKAG
jgi:hypothetical protein